MGTEKNCYTLQSGSLLKSKTKKDLLFMVSTLFVITIYSFGVKQHCVKLNDTDPSF